MKCVVCKQREAIMPDRDSDSMKKAVCQICHEEKLRRSLVEIFGKKTNDERWRRKE